jgi:site-specific DNA recombinase
VDLAVWQEVCALLPPLERLAEEYRRRLQPQTRATRTPLATIEDQTSKVRQGVARWIDSHAESLIDQSELEPRIPRLRQRLARLEEQRQALAEEAAWQGELPLIMGRLEDFATKLHDGLEAADWASKRDLIRALVKRVEVARNEVNVVFRIDPYPGDNDPEKKSLQLCRGRDDSALWCPTMGLVVLPIFDISRFQHGADEVQKLRVLNSLLQHFHEDVMVDVVEVPVCVDVDKPFSPVPYSFNGFQGRVT